MLTDGKPVLLADFLESDRNRVLDVPQDDRLKTPSTTLEAALKAGTTTAVRRACAEFLNTAADFYQSPVPEISELIWPGLRLRCRRLRCEPDDRENR